MADKVANEEIRVEERQRQCHAEDDDEDVPHALLRIDGADADDFLAVLFRGRLGVEFYVLLDINHRAIRAGDDRLGGRAGEPVNHRAAHEEAEDDFRLHEAQMADHVAEQVLQQDDDAEDHGGGADDGGADEHGFGGGLEGVARAVTLFQLILGVFKVRVETEVLLDFLLDARALPGRTCARLLDRIRSLMQVGVSSVGLNGRSQRSPPHLRCSQQHFKVREPGRVQPLQEAGQLGFGKKEVSRGFGGF